MSVLQKLTEGIVHRDIGREGQAILTKWEQTGLLEGLNNERTKQNMAVLLENQAKELLREASSMAAGDVEGFAAVAFPIVRRVFGGLIANDLVSVQPMSLPSGLIFFLDFTTAESQLGATADTSVYGGNVVGSQITGGVNLGDLADDRGAGGHYNMGNAHASAHFSASVALARISNDAIGGSSTIADLSDALKRVIRYDADVLALPGTTELTITRIDSTGLDALKARGLDTGRLAGVEITTSLVGIADTEPGHIRRLTQIIDDELVLVCVGDDAAINAGADLDLRFPIKDELGATTNVPGGVVAGIPMHLEEPSPRLGGGSEAVTADKNTIAEIDIKVDSIAVTAQTKKLKAKWSPELGQDLNAYHNLDAEVELTGILSEQIALEIDRELLFELVNGATAGTRYWSRAPGLFVDSSGAETGANSAAPDFTGTVSEWYETLIETINDVSAQIHRKTLRGGANFVVCSPEVANILEFTSGFRASVTADQDRGTIGAVKAGSLSKKFDVYVDPYFLRNVLLVGRKGSSFLESGFVYAPYVPLQVTPTIFGTEDFVPRKGVMTRYAKKMVRPDMYGLVVVRGLLGESGG